MLSVFQASNGFCLEDPKAGKRDKRVKFINYNAAEVVKIVGYYGYSTHIEFNASEVVENIAIGDKDAWDIAPTGNHIFIKPKAKKPSTNMIVITNKRVYTFQLTGKWSAHGGQSDKMYFAVNFRYPDQIKLADQKQAKANELRKALKTESSTPTNWNYAAKGSQSVTPTKAYDDGRFTYLSFANNGEMPAVFIVDDDKKESLVNTNINPKFPDTIIVHKVTRRLVLRKGNSVACVFNENYDPMSGESNFTGTSLPHVKRVVKGVKN